MCKHVAATLYGVGARLDAEPELLFSLRKVDAKELIARAGDGGPPVSKAPRAGRILDASRLADVFGIDMAGSGTKQPPARAPARATKTAPPARHAKKTSPKRKAPQRSRG
jgi:uncharacterized Zn finger protein